MGIKLKDLVDEGYYLFYSVDYPLPAVGQWDKAEAMFVLTGMDTAYILDDGVPLYVNAADVLEVVLEIRKTGPNG